MRRGNLRGENGTRYKGQDLSKHRSCPRLSPFLGLLMAVNCDIIIVGGGVMGASIAWQLAQRRAGKVMLLEKSFLGAGSSGKSGAIIRQHYSNRLTASMAQKSCVF